MCGCVHVVEILSLNPQPDHLYQPVTEGQWREGESPHHKPCPIRNRLASTDTHIHTPVHCQHICSTVHGPVKCPSCNTGQLKKAENMSGLHTQQFSEMRDRAICCHNYNSRTLCGHSYIEGTLSRASAVELRSDNTYNSQCGQNILMLWLLIWWMERQTSRWMETMDGWNNTMINR